MIFVTVGTHEQQFNRLLIAIDRFMSSGIIQEEVIAQVGYSTYIPQHYTFKQFFSYDEMLDLIKKARMVITHAGPATLFQCWMNAKIPIVFPRNPQYNEHVDEHQMLFASYLKNSKISLVAFDEEELKNRIINYEQFKAKCDVPSIRCNFAENVGKYVDEIIISKILGVKK